MKFQDIFKGYDQIKLVDYVKSMLYSKNIPAPIVCSFELNGTMRYFIVKAIQVILPLNQKKARLFLIETHTPFMTMATIDDAFYTQYRISNRERDILLDIMKGSCNKTISEKYFISENAVKKHISNIFNKTGVNKRYDLKKLLSQYQSN